MAEAESAHELALKMVDDQLTCPVCFETYTNPKLLSCHHVFCQKCLERLSVTTPRLSCPNCREITELPPKGIPGLQTAFHITNLFEIRDNLRKARPPQVVPTQPLQPNLEGCKKCQLMDVSWYCCDCHQYMCGGCAESHRTQEGSSSHTVEDIRKRQSDCEKRTSECPLHSGKALELYCEKCEELICNECIIESHQDHCMYLNLVANILPRHREELMSHTMLMEQQKQMLDRTVEYLGLHSKDVTDQQMDTAANIQETFTRLQAKLEARKVELVDQLDQITQRKLESVTLQRGHVEELQARLGSCLDLVHQCLESGTKEELIASKTSLVKQMEEIGDEINVAVSTPIEIEETYFIVSEAKLQAFSGVGEIYSGGSPCSVECVASVEGLKAVTKVGEENIVCVKLKEKHRLKMKELLDCVKADLESCESGNTMKCTVELIGESTYEINYRPTERGEHRLHIKVNEKPIQGSPLVLTAKLPIAMLGTPVRIIPHLQHPWGLAVDSQRNIIVAEFKGKHVGVFSPSGERIQTIGRRGLLQNQFQQPMGIAVDCDGNVLVTDISYSNIQRCTVSGQMLQSVGSQGSESLQFTYPAGIGFNSTNGKIYVTEWERNNRVQIINGDLTSYKSFGGKGDAPGEFQSPTDVAFDSAGNVYVVDSDNHRVQVFTADGIYLREIGKRGKKDGKLALPSSVCIDSEDLVYVTERRNQRVSIFTSEGTFVRWFGGQGSQPGQFNHPHGIAVDRDGFVYVSDSDNSRIQIF